MNNNEHELESKSSSVPGDTIQSNKEKWQPSDADKKFSENLTINTVGRAVILDEHGMSYFSTGNLRYFVNLALLEAIEYGRNLK